MTGREQVPARVELEDLPRGTDRRPEQLARDQRLGPLFGSTSSSLAAISEFAVGELIFAITVGEPISV